MVFSFNYYAIIVLDKTFKAYLMLVVTATKKLSLTSDPSLDFITNGCKIFRESQTRIPFFVLGINMNDW